MTEAEWLVTDDPTPMLAFLRETGNVSERRLRLFGVACCRGIWHLLTDERCRNAVEVAERHADGLARRKELLATLAVMRNLHDGSRRESSFDCALHAASYTCQGGDALSKVATMASWAVFYSHEVNVVASNAELIARTSQAGLLRNIFGNPFRPVTLAAAHRTPSVVSLAQAAYDEGQLPSGDLDPHRLAVLADALEEVGAPAELVGHLRGPGSHVRGCFVVDLCLGLS